MRDVLDICKRLRSFLSYLSYYSGQLPQHRSITIVDYQQMRLSRFRGSFIKGQSCAAFGDARRQGVGRRRSKPTQKPILKPIKRSGFPQMQLFFVFYLALSPRTFVKATQRHGSQSQSCALDKPAAPEASWIYRLSRLSRE